MTIHNKHSDKGGGAPRAQDKPAANYTRVAQPISSLA
jgi:hypothetical protein